MRPPRPILLPPRTSGEQRRGLRIAVDIAATVCSTAVARRTVAMTDLSVDGCRLETPFSWPEGSLVVITIPTLAPRAARVRWRSADAAGLLFEQRLSALIVQYVVTLARRRAAGREEWPIGG